MQSERIIGRVQADMTKQMEKKKKYTEELSRLQSDIEILDRQINEFETRCSLQQHHPPIPPPSLSSLALPPPASFVLVVLYGDTETIVSFPFLLCVCRIFSSFLQFYPFLVLNNHGLHSSD